MKTQITAPNRNELTTEFQSFLTPLTEERYIHFFNKGVEKASTVEDVYNQRHKVREQFNAFAASLVKAEAQKDEEAISAAKGSIAALKAMELGFETALRSEL